MSATTALVTGVRLVPVGTGPAPATDGPVDLRLAGGRVTQVGRGLTRLAGEEVHDAAGLWAMPGLWDHHVHLGQWALTSQRVDVSGARSAQEAAAVVAGHVRREPPAPGAVVQGFGQRPVLWDRQPATADLDAAVGDVPVVMVSGDAHHGWLSSAGFRTLGMSPRPGVLEEEDWWPVFAGLSALPGSADLLEAGYRTVLREALALGVTGLVDMEMDTGYRDWPARSAAGAVLPRLRQAVYQPQLDDVLGLGLRTGQVLDERGLVEMGPLKVISDGSLNTRTARCCQPYADGDGLAAPYGVQNVEAAELTALLRRARAGGLEAAVHAIGDEALRQVLDAFEASGATGAVEHAQLVRAEDVPRMAALGVRASVQPAHLLDDRDVLDVCWPDRAERCFPLASLHRAGVEVVLGSDAPVAPLDPWLAMAAAVHRSADERDPWQPQEALTLAQALAASTDGQGTLGVGSRADLVLLETNPAGFEGDSRAISDALRTVRPLATLVDGHPVTGTPG